MGKLEDPNFRYFTKAESEMPGYLQRKMQIYKEMIESERQNSQLSKREKNTGNSQADGRAFSDDPKIYNRLMQRVVRVK